jgi:hypothetical protein
MRSRRGAAGCKNGDNSMDPRAAPKESDPHSRRIIFDMIEWHERLERLAEMRRRAITSVARSHGDSAETREILTAEGDGSA